MNENFITFALSVALAMTTLGTILAVYIAINIDCMFGELSEIKSQLSEKNRKTVKFITADNLDFVPNADDDVDIMEFHKEAE